MLHEVQNRACKTKTGSLGCQSAPMAMEPPRRFEFAVIENIFDKGLVAEVLRHPQSWEELCPDPSLDRLLERWTESLPPTVDEEREDDFYLFVDNDFLCCRPKQRLRRRQVWICSVRAEDPAVPPELQTAAFDKAKRVAVREVPPTLVLTCGLTELAQGLFQAKFTTLADELMLSIQCPPGAEAALTMSACKAAASQGRLQSRNQEVCVLLEGETEPLGIEKVPDLYWSWLEMI